MEQARRRGGAELCHRRLSCTGTTKLLRAQRCYPLKTPLIGGKEGRVIALYRALFDITIGKRLVRFLEYYPSSALDSHRSREDPPWQMVASRWTTSKASGVLLVALANLGRDRSCKQPKGQALFFLVDYGHPEMLSALGAEKLRDVLEGTML